MDLIVVPAPHIPKGEAACAVCHRKLDVYVQRENGVEHIIGFTHTVGADHTPEPVHVGANGFKAVCDFCGDERPLWAYPCGLVVAVNGDEFGPNVPDSRSSDEWAACNDCHEDIGHDRWERVARRSVTNLIKEGKLDRAHKLHALGYVRKLHREFRKQRSGDPYLDVVVDHIVMEGGDRIVPPEAS